MENLKNEFGSIEPENYSNVCCGVCGSDHLVLNVRGMSLAPVIYFCYACNEYYDQDDIGIIETK